MKKEIKARKQKDGGITLIGLIVTIVVLLILAGITINLTIGEEGIIRRAQEAGKNIMLAQEQENKALEELYSSMIVATNDSSKITISMEDLNSLIDTKIEERVSALNNEVRELTNKIEILENTTSPIYIDVNNVLTTICEGDQLSEVSYTATENCIIAGYVRSWSSGSEAHIMIDNIRMFVVGGSSTTYGDSKPIYIPLKKGQTIKVQFNNTDNGTNILKAYGIL